MGGGSVAMLPRHSIYGGVSSRARTVRLGTGLDYNVHEWGTPERGHTVLLLHGFLDLGWSWTPVVDEGLADRLHVIAPDLRGHGDSGWIGAGGYYHFADYVADLDDLLRQVTIGSRLSLVGHSMGGSLATMLAGTFPEKVHRVALLEGMGPPETNDLGPERMLAWLDAWRRVREKAPRTYASLAEAAARLRENDPLLSEELALRLVEHATRPGADGRLRFKHDPLHATVGYYAYKVETAMRYWSRIACPVLLLEGGLSTFRLSDEERARRQAAFRDARRAVIPGAGHMMQRHQPRAVAQALVEFLCP
jgi:pimeloyl-ACP methyl ester carboxylesterase